MKRHRMYGAAFAAALALAVPASSQAAQRYASPNGNGTTCSYQFPCDLSKAMTAASPHDAVLVLPGEYSLTATQIVPQDVTIQGTDGAAKTHITFSGAQHRLNMGDGSALSDVQIDSDTGAILAQKATIERVVLHGSGEEDGYPVASLQDSLMRNSIVTANGVEGYAVSATSTSGQHSSTLRNVTAVSTANYGVAVRARGDGANVDTVLTIENTIAAGAPGGEDVEAFGDNGGHAHVVAHRSNFDNSSAIGNGTVPTAGEADNQTQLPSFAVDYHEKAGSPTIDAGKDDAANGDYDVDRNARTIGQTDIGADEFVQPSDQGSGQPASTPAGKPKAPAASQTITSTRDTVAPVLGALTFRQRRLRYRLSEKASVQISVYRRIHGHYRRARSLALKGKAGTNRLRMSSLARGRYKVTLVARDAAGNRSKARSAGLRVRR